MHSSSGDGGRYAERFALRAHERFIASHMGGLGSQIYGVRDRARDAWHSPEKFTIDEAEGRATELNAEFTKWGRRPASDARRLDPPGSVDVEFLQWTEGILDCWIR